MQRKHLILGVVATSLAVTGFSVTSYAARQKPTPEQRAEWMIKRVDTNNDSKVSLEEAQAGASKAFAAFDTNGDGQVSREEIKARREAMKTARTELREIRKDGTDAQKAEAREKMKALRVGMFVGAKGKRFDRADTDKNGSLSQAEVAAATERMFKRRDRNGDGFFDVADVKKS